jgi:hypothetical protein
VGQELGERTVSVGGASQGAGTGRVDPDHVELTVEHEDADRHRLQHHLDEPLLGVELLGPVGDHPLQLGVEAGVLQRNRRLARQRHQELLLMRRELVDAVPQDGDRTDRVVAPEQRRHEHRAIAAAAGHVGIHRAGVDRQVGALHGTSLLHRETRDPLALLQPDRRPQGGRYVEARGHHELARRGIDRQQSARVDAEDAACLFQQDPDRPVHVEAGGDRPACLEERVSFSRPPAALLGEAPPLDPEGQRARELGDHLEVAIPQRAGPGGGERDGAEHGARR